MMAVVTLRRVSSSSSSASNSTVSACTISPRGGTSCAPGRGTGSVESRVAMIWRMPRRSRSSDAVIQPHASRASSIDSAVPPSTPATAGGCQTAVAVSSSALVAPENTMMRLRIDRACEEFRGKRHGSRAPRATPWQATSLRRFRVEGSHRPQAPGRWGGNKEKAESARRGGRCRPSAPRLSAPP